MLDAATSGEEAGIEHYLRCLLCARELPTAPLGTRIERLLGDGRWWSAGRLSRVLVAPRADINRELRQLVALHILSVIRRSNLTHYYRIEEHSNDRAA